MEKLNCTVAEKLRKIIVKWKNLSTRKNIKNMYGHFTSNCVTKKQ